MRRLPKLRKVCKWTGLVLSVLLLVVWVGSWRYNFAWHSSSGNRLGIAGGTVAFKQSVSNRPAKTVWVVRPWRSPAQWRFDWAFYQYEWFVVIPLWAPLLCPSAPAGVLWRRDLRLSKPGLCKQCGYDIRGLEVCPECGVGEGVRRKGFKAPTGRISHSPGREPWVRVARVLSPEGAS